MKASYPFDPDLHEAGSPAAEGRCGYHAEGGPGGGEGCAGEAVVSFEGGQGGWQSWCTAALQELVEREEIEPLGQGA